MTYLIYATVGLVIIAAFAELIASLIPPNPVRQVLNYSRTESLLATLPMIPYAWVMLTVIAPLDAAWLTKLGYWLVADVLRLITIVGIHLCFSPKGWTLPEALMRSFSIAPSSRCPWKGFKLQL